jgi:hypothetical protein
MSDAYGSLTFSKSADFTVDSSMLSKELNFDHNLPVSVLSLISIGKLAESYRRKSFGGTEKRQDNKNQTMSYSFKPAWRTWKEENSCFLLKVTVSMFIDMKFAESRFLWFNILATPYGIKALCCENSDLRFGLASKKFLDTAYENLSKTNLLLPKQRVSGSRLEPIFIED